jgi:hypothetical protein
MQPELKRGLSCLPKQMQSTSSLRCRLRVLVLVFSLSVLALILLFVLHGQTFDKVLINVEVETREKTQIVRKEFIIQRLWNTFNCEDALTQELDSYRISALQLLCSRNESAHLVQISAQDSYDMELLVNLTSENGWLEESYVCFYQGDKYSSNVVSSYSDCSYVLNSPYYCMGIRNKVYC